MVQIVLFYCGPLNQDSFSVSESEQIGNFKWKQFKCQKCAGSQVAVDLSKEFDGVGERRFSGSEVKYWKPTKSSIIFDT